MKESFQQAIVETGNTVIDALLLAAGKLKRALSAS
jgi:hypothetical protein